MHPSSVMKLKAGQTLYMVYPQTGMVAAMAIKRREISEGCPLLTGLVYIVMNGGNAPFMPSDPEEASLWFSHIVEWKYPITTSRKRAERWAKQGYARERGVWAIKQDEYIIRFEVQTETPEDQAKLETALA